MPGEGGLVFQVVGRVTMYPDQSRGTKERRLRLLGPAIPAIPSSLPRIYNVMSSMTISPLQVGLHDSLREHLSISKWTVISSRRQAGFLKSIIRRIPRDTIPETTLIYSHSTLCKDPETICLKALFLFSRVRTLSSI